MKQYLYFTNINIVFIQENENKMPVKEKSAGIILFRREAPQRKSLLHGFHASLGWQETYYLLLHYQAGHWDFSKGNIEPGESEQQAAIRELKEETGITQTTLIQGFKSRVSFSFKRDEQLVKKEVLYFLAETKELKVKLTEHSAYLWLPYDKALQQLTFKNSQELLKKANKAVQAAIRKS